MCVRLVFDIETDGLEATRVWCLVIRNLDDETEVRSYVGEEIRVGLDRLQEADECWGHAVISFDYPTLARLYPGFQLRPDRVFDSLLASQLAFPDLKKYDYSTAGLEMPKALAGSHSLEAWGWRLGSAKAGLDVSFASLTPQLRERCIQDTAITVDVIRQCTSLLPARAWLLERQLAPYLVQQQANGVHFDMEKAQSLVAKLRQKQHLLHQAAITWGGTWTQESGKPFVPKRTNAKLGYVSGIPVQKYKLVEFNPNSRAHIIKRLKETYGWEPTVFTEANNPKLDEAVLAPLAQATLPDGTPRFPAVQTLLDWFETGKQLGYISDSPGTPWMKAASATDSSTIHGRVHQMGTSYGRASHSKPNLGQVPKKPEFRELFYVPERIQDQEWVLVGVDMSGAQLRMLAHYATPYDGGELAKVILDGDFHQTNADNWGVDRDTAKTGIFAFIFGCADKKLGLSLYPYLLTDRDLYKAGRMARSLLMDRFGGLAKLDARAREKAGGQGYLTGLDGRRLPCRADYRALNNMLQSAEGICAKQTIVNYDRSLTQMLGPQGWTGKWAAQLWNHDEFQLASGAEHGELVKGTIIESIAMAGEQFNLAVPLTGEGKIGHNWSESH